MPRIIYWLIAMLVPVNLFSPPSAMDSEKPGWLLQPSKQKDSQVSPAPVEELLSIKPL